MKTEPIMVDLSVLPEYWMIHRGGPGEGWWIYDIHGDGVGNGETPDAALKAAGLIRI